MVCILISTSISLQVFHIPGTDNSVTDALSWHLPETAITLSPGLQVNLFQPPCDALGWQEWCLQHHTNPGNHSGLPGHASVFCTSALSPLDTLLTIQHYTHIIPIYNLTFHFASFTNSHSNQLLIHSASILYLCATTSNLIRLHNISQALSAPSNHTFLTFANAIITSSFCTPLLVWRSCMVARLCVVLHSNCSR